LDLSQNINRIDEGIRVEDFDKILNFHSIQDNVHERRGNYNQNAILNNPINNVNFNNINNSENYSLLASKNRMGRIKSPSESVTPTINKINNSCNSDITDKSKIN
jgi:hypothetical protein